MAGIINLNPEAMKRLLLLAVAGSLVAPPASAGGTAGQAQEPTSFQTQVAGIMAKMTAQRPCASIIIGVSSGAPSLADAMTVLHDKLQQVDELAKQQGIKEFELDSMHFSVNRNYPNPALVTAGQPAYHLNGSIDYQLGSRDDAFKLSEILTQREFRVTVSAADRNTACANSVTNK